jgi:hypothetical protein
MQMSRYRFMFLKNCLIRKKLGWLNPCARLRGEFKERSSVDGLDNLLAGGENSPVTSKPVDSSFSVDRSADRLDSKSAEGNLVGFDPPPGTNEINDLPNERIFGCVFLCPNCAQIGALLRFPSCIVPPFLLKPFARCCASGCPV